MPAALCACVCSRGATYDLFETAGQVALIDKPKLIGNIGQRYFGCLDQ
jgi:hypothetical protein